jgi:hypothetical protein
MVSLCFVPLIFPLAALGAPFCRMLKTKAPAISQQNKVKRDLFYKKISSLNPF